MLRHVLRLLLLAGAAIASASGAIIPFGSDLANEWNNVTGTNVIINMDPVWATLAPYSWISYADTGQPGSVRPPNATIPGTPTAIFREFLPALTAAINVTVFADDTADIYLFDLSNPGGLLLFAANPIQDSHCAAGPIGCQVGEGWTSGYLPVNAMGPAYLEIRAYQRGGGPFGVLYGGQAYLVPEPGTLLLFGAGLLSLGLLQRFRSARSQR